MRQIKKTVLSVLFVGATWRELINGRFLVLSLISSSVGCLGCYRQAVVPPAASINQPSRAPVITPPPLAPPGQAEAKQTDTSPVTPVAKDDPWKPGAAARDWRYIVLHHTASDRGDVESIHAAHLKNKDKNGKAWLGIGYHFVIGNGNGMQDGEIQPTFRWRQQIQGAHAGVAEYNQLGVGIVLVGNFQNAPPTDAQIAAAKRLVRALAREYEIEPSQIVGHTDVKATECPGAHFPLSEIRDSVVAMWLGRQQADARP